MQLECGQRRPPTAESDGKCRFYRTLPSPTSQRQTCPFSFAPDGTPPARPYAAPTPARCEPVPVFPLLPRPSTCPAWPSAASVAAGCEPFPAFLLLPGPSTCPAWLSATSVASRCEPVPAFPLLPGPPTCPAKPSAAPVASRCEPFSANRLYLRRVTQASWPGTVVAGVREQAASCDAFVLSRRRPAPDAPPSRASPLCLIAKALPNSHRTTAR